MANGASPPPPRAVEDGADAEDQEPFLIHYANVETDTAGQSVLTHSVGQVFVAPRSSVPRSRGSRSRRTSREPPHVGFANVTASRTIARLYGAAGLTQTAPFFVTTNGNRDDWTAAQPVTSEPLRVRRG